MRHFYALAVIMLVLLQARTLAAQEVKIENKQDYYLADDFIENENFSSASTYYGFLTESYPKEARFFFLKGFADYSDGRIGSAESSFVRTLELDSSSLDSKNYLFLIYKKQGDKDKACQILNNLEEDTWGLRKENSKYCENSANTK